MYEISSESKQIVANRSATNSDVKEKVCSVKNGFVKFCSENASRRKNEHNVLPNLKNFKGEQFLLFFF